MGLRTEILDGMAEAAAVVAEIGDLITLELVEKGEYDPIAGTWSSGTTREQQPRAILDNYSLQSSGQQYAGGTQILRDDKRLFIPASELEWPPTLATTATLSGEVWQIISIQTINPTGDVLAYELQVRR